MKASETKKMVPRLDVSEKKHVKVGTNRKFFMEMLKRFI